MDGHFVGEDENRPHAKPGLQLQQPIDERFSGQIA